MARGGPFRLSFVFQSVGVALGEGHAVAERAPLVADDSVQRMADIVQNSQQSVGCSPLCPQRVQLHAEHRAGRLINLFSLDDGGGARAGGQ